MVVVVVVVSAFGNNKLEYLLVTCSIHELSHGETPVVVSRRK